MHVAKLRPVTGGSRGHPVARVLWLGSFFGNSTSDRRPHKSNPTFNMATCQSQSCTRKLTKTADGGCASCARHCTSDDCKTQGHLDLKEAVAEARYVPPCKRSRSIVANDFDGFCSCGADLTSHRKSARAAGQEPRTKKRKRSRSEERRSEPDDSNSDSDCASDEGDSSEEDPAPTSATDKFELGPDSTAILEKMSKDPVDLSRASRILRAGTLQWVGDTTLFPISSSALPSDTKVTDPLPVFFNLSLMDMVLAAKILAATVMHSDPASLRESAARKLFDDPKHEVFFDALWSSVISASKAKSPIFISPKSGVQAALVRITCAIGRKARAHRAKQKAKIHHTARSEVQIREAENSFTDWLTYSMREEAEKDLENLEKGTFSTSVWESRNDVNFAVGVALVEAGISRDTGCRALWRLVDKAEIKVRARLKRDHADDVRMARSAARAADSKRDREAMAAASASATAAAIRQASRPGGSNRDPKEKTSENAKPSPKRQQGAPAAGSSTPGTAGRSRADILASPASGRSDADCRKLGMCLKCREPGHRRFECTASVDVTYVP